MNNYLLLLETPNIHPGNGIPINFNRYNKIFTWRDDLVDGLRFIKVNLPNPLVVPKVDGWSERIRFCCLIAGNKSLPKPDHRDLYIERIKDIRWFEQNAAGEFDLYGTGWDVPSLRNNYFGKALRRTYRALSAVVDLQPFPSYRGKVGNKRDVLLRTRYSICYENVKDYPGYITEKIFDCFFAGCIPVYWGASNVANHIPSDCFIDRRQFKDTNAVHKHLKTITEAEYVEYQIRIASFLASDAARQFSSNAFVETVARTIVADLER